ncbi:ROK family protein [Goodfellowiella coeruleoviolacea]|uniref:Glucokinase n=1 Tax=Goodfellowiella coeruleoviolacea TaxID=334858 RepID=A0AAE3GD37_9PSEU|nr:ROK family protein [Goodfellowiella coeruleoviolacea]MCP2165027.1 glucokinase [Goodfellowiella coeruleoviolacea]
MTGGAVLAGVDIGGTTTLAVLSDGGPRPLATTRLATPAAQGGAAMLAAAASAVRTLLADTGTPATALAGVGVGAAGVIDPDTGRVLAASDSFRDWVGTDVNQELSGLLGGCPVWTDNDVNAFLLGELAAGEQPAPRHAMAITLGTGVGGALLVDGVLLHGGPAGAGEIGHVGRFGDRRCTCGQIGHLEAYASGRSLGRRYTEATGQERTAAAVAEAARAGDADALRIYREAGRFLGEAIATGCGLLGVDLAVVGGSVVRSWPLLADAVTRVLRERPLLTGEPVRVRPGVLGEYAVAIGAAALALARIGGVPASR